MNNTLRTPVLLLLLLALLTACPNRPALDDSPPRGPGGEWTSWRGPNGDGTIAVQGLADDWNRHEPREVWRRTLGEGFGGIAVAADRAFVLFAEGSTEYLVALSARDGSELWRLKLGDTLLDRTGNGPRTTPTVDTNSVPQVVYAVGTHRIVAVNAEAGGELWRAELAPPPLWGFSSSPLLVDDLLVVHAAVPDPSGAPPAPVTAFRRIDGSVVWRAGQGLPGYASPQRVTLHGRSQILSFTGEGLLALVPESGEVLWHHSWKTSYGVNAADPVLYPPDKIFISSGYDTGAALLQVTLQGERFVAEELWTSRAMKNHFSSSVRVGDHLYGFDNATLKAIDLTDGSTRWRHRGFGKGSLLVVNERLVVLGDEGSLALVESNPEKYNELGSVKALDHGSWTPPSLAGQWLYLRDHQEIVCLNLAQHH